MMIYCYFFKCILLETHISSEDLIVDSKYEIKQHLKWMHNSEIKYQMHDLSCSQNEEYILI